MAYQTNARQTVHSLIEDLLAVILGIAIGVGVTSMYVRLLKKSKKIEQLKLDRKKIYRPEIVNPPSVIVPEHTTKRWRKLPVSTTNDLFVEHVPGEWVTVELTPEAPKAPVEPVAPATPNPSSDTVSAPVEPPGEGVLPPRLSQEALWGYDDREGNPNKGFFDD